MEATGYPNRRRRPVSSCDGFTVLEVLIALALFTVAMLFGGRAIVGFVHQVGLSEARAQATEFALEELERVRLLPYEDIVAVGPASVPAAPGYTRSVNVAVIGSQPEELYAYRVITVTVEPPSGVAPVSVSTAVAEQP